MLHCIEIIRRSRAGNHDLVGPLPCSVRCCYGCEERMCRPLPNVTELLLVPAVSFSCPFFCIAPIWPIVFFDICFMLLTLYFVLSLLFHMCFVPRGCWFVCRCYIMVFGILYIELTVIEFKITFSFCGPSFLAFYISVGIP